MKIKKFSLYLLFTLSFFVFISCGTTGAVKKDVSIQKLIQEGRYDEAKELFLEIIDYKDSKDQITECDYLKACELLDNGTYFTAKKIFEKLGSYKDSKAKIDMCNEKMRHLTDHYGR